jgi:hypothetical protein
MQDPGDSPAKGSKNIPQLLVAYGPETACSFVKSTINGIIKLINRYVAY